MTNFPDIEEAIYKPLKSPLRLDVMIGDIFYTTIAIKVEVGMSYTLSELKSFARIKLPSLVNKDFKLLPSTGPIFKH